MTPIPEAWEPLFREEQDKPYWQKLADFLQQERAAYRVYPPEPDVFTALSLTDPSAIRVIILGQDPYHQPGQAHGLAFSVRAGVAAPPSLKNIFKEMHHDIGTPIPSTGTLTHWASQGVLLLNAVLTVREGEPNSHKNKGWELFTDAVLRAAAAHSQPLVYVLWGANARSKAGLADPARDTVIQSAHPSPLSAHHGFFGSRPFSQANAALVENGRGPIHWELP